MQVVGQCVGQSSSKVTRLPTWGQPYISRPSPNGTTKVSIWKRWPVCVCARGLGGRLESKVSMWRKSCRVLQPKVNEEGVHDGLHLGRGSQSLRKGKKADVGCHCLEGEEGIHAWE